MGRYSGKTCRLLSMLSLTASFFLVEIIVGYVTNSIALVADSFHMLSDVVALIVGFASVRISKWQTQKNTFGWARAEVLGAMVNAVFLVALCFSILVEALKRLVTYEEVENPKLMLIVGGAGLLVNVIGLFLFHNHGHSHGGGSHGHGHSHGGDDHHDNKGEKEALVDGASANGSIKPVVSDINQASSSQLNMRGVFLHVLGDALGSVIVVVSALVIWFAEGSWRFYVDPAMSILMVIIILGTTVPLLKESGFILLQTVPSHLKVAEIKKKVEKIDGILAVHEFHIWQLAGNRIIASAHIRCKNLHDYMETAEKVKALFHNEGIHSTTIQPEFALPLEDELDHPPVNNCVLECESKQCLNDSCCPPRTDSKKGNGSEESSREGSVKNRRSQEPTSPTNNSSGKKGS
ncbi:hypothetical protein FSP39_013609 [Pinctada imbricata]|uniref:Zinc transporter 1 n=1 Tax=Pinctada imbricata TaxID=66713 RepID=A0AA88YP72_PINIB|nr:hypothetical protein FSP39_013609 [Pinctada imbricata]